MSAHVACHLVSARRGKSEVPSDRSTGPKLVVLDSDQHTSDTSDPVAINGQNLTFSEDPHAFDAAFQ